MKKTYFKYFLLVVLTLGVLCSVDVEHGHGQFPCGYKYFSEAEGWFKIHLEGTTWSQASRICDLEGALLASPATNPMKYLMASLMQPYRVQNDTPYDNPFIVHTAMHPKGGDVSVEALGLMDTGRLVTVSQNDFLSYICYKKAPEEMAQLNECGTTDSGYALDNRTQHCYKFHRVQLTWSEAIATCATEGGYLAIINSAEEAQVMIDIFEGQSFADAGYDLWSPGEPDNARGDKFCRTIGRLGKITERPCPRGKPFICEKETTKRCGEPSTSEPST